MGLKEGDVIDNRVQAAREHASGVWRLELELADMKMAEN